MRSRTRRENVAFGGVFVIILMFLALGYAATHGRPDLYQKDGEPAPQAAATMPAVAPSAGVVAVPTNMPYPSAAGLYQASCTITGGNTINGKIAVDVTADPQKITSIHLKDDATGQVYDVSLSDALCQFSPTN